MPRLPRRSLALSLLLSTMPFQAGCMDGLWEIFVRSSDPRVPGRNFLVDVRSDPYGGARIDVRAPGTSIGVGAGPNGFGVDVNTPGVVVRGGGAFPPGAQGFGPPQLQSPLGIKPMPAAPVTATGPRAPGTTPPTGTTSTDPTNTGPVVASTPDGVLDPTGTGYPNATQPVGTGPLAPTGTGTQVPLTAVAPLGPPNPQSTEIQQRPLYEVGPTFDDVIREAGSIDSQ